MSIGIIKYNEDGLPMCEICGKHFKRVTYHVRQVHGISARDYKKAYGFDLIKGICSASSSQKTSEQTISNYEKVIVPNLLNGGKETRFKDGSKGRTKDKVSEQTYIRLKQLRQNYLFKKI